MVYSSCKRITVTSTGGRHKEYRKQCYYDKGRRTKTGRRPVRQTVDTFTRIMGIIHRGSGNGPPHLDYSLPLSFHRPSTLRPAILPWFSPFGGSRHFPNYHFFCSITIDVRYTSLYRLKGRREHIYNTLLQAFVSPSPLRLECIRREANAANASGVPTEFLLYGISPKYIFLT